MTAGTEMGKGLASGARSSPSNQSVLLTPDQLACYQPWLDNARRLRQLATELETLTIQAVQHAEGWGS